MDLVNQFVHPTYSTLPPLYTGMQAVLYGAV